MLIQFLDPQINVSIRCNQCYLKITDKMMKPSTACMPLSCNLGEGILCGEGRREGERRKSAIMFKCLFVSKYFTKRSSGLYEYQRMRGTYLEKILSSLNVSYLWKFPAISFVERFLFQLIKISNYKKTELKFLICCRNRNNNNWTYLTENTIFFCDTSERNCFVLNTRFC